MLTIYLRIKNICISIFRINGFCKFILMPGKPISPTKEKLKLAFASVTNRLTRSNSEDQHRIYGDSDEDLVRQELAEEVNAQLQQEKQAHLEHERLKNFRSTIAVNANEGQENPLHEQLRRPRPKPKKHLEQRPQSERIIPKKDIKGIDILKQFVIILRPQNVLEFEFATII